MRVNLFFIGVFFTCAFIVADDVFVAKAAKKQSNAALKEKIVHGIKQLMRECNNLIRTISLQHDYLITQIEDLSESEKFFAQADNKELASCAYHLEELCASLQKTRLEIDRTVGQAFKSRKK